MSEPYPPASIPPQDLGWDELLDSRPDRPPQEVIDAVKHDLGLDTTRRVRYRGDHPDVNTASLRDRLDI